MIKEIISLGVRLLEEGTPTVRPTQAEVLGDGLYKLLPTENYDPEDEIWEFLPGSVVKAKKIPDEKGNPRLLATALPVSRTTLLDKNIGAAIVPMEVTVEKNTTIKTEAIALSHGLYQLLPTDDYNPDIATWEFSPGAIVRAHINKNTGNLLAFDQIREDRLGGEYARHVLEQDRQ